MSMLPVKKILWPTDFSEPSYKALVAAAGFAEHFGADLFCLHVIEPPPLSSEWAEASKFSVPLPVQKDRDRRERELNKILADRMPDKFAGKVFVVIGDVPDSIHEFVQSKQVDLIIIATHGRTGWRRLVLGSVAEQVIREAPCPVLAIRQNNNTNQKKE